MAAPGYVHAENAGVLRQFWLEHELVFPLGEPRWYLALQRISRTAIGDRHIEQVLAIPGIGQTGIGGGQRPQPLLAPQNVVARRHGDQLVWRDELLAHT